MSRDYRKDYEELQRAVETRRQAAMEARGHLAALDAREQELRVELAALGVQDLERLDAELAAEEQAVEQLIASIRQQLAVPQQGPVRAIALPQQSQAAQGQKQPMSLEELLVLGSRG